MKPVIPAIKPEEYAKQGGYLCPMCKSNKACPIGELTSSFTSAWQDIKCTVCGATWTDCYTLIGFDDLKVGK